MKYVSKSNLKIGVLILLLIFGLIQFIPKPERNMSTAVGKSGIEHLYPMPDSILLILKIACYDCHSNHTHYPWYSDIQPISRILNKHIVEGKSELNFDEFGTYSGRRQRSKMKAIVNQVEEDEMPLKSYKLLHKKAELNKHEKAQIINWAYSHLERNN